MRQKIDKILDNTEEIIGILKKKDKEGKFVKCGRCGYVWKTGSKLKYLSCPNCNYKTKNISIIKDNINKEIEKLSEVGKDNKSKYDYLDPVFDG